MTGIGPDGSEGTDIGERGADAVGSGGGGGKGSNNQNVSSNGESGGRGSITGGSQLKPTGGGLTRTVA